MTRPALLMLALSLLLFLLPACQTQRTVLISADGETRLVLIRQAETVGDALQEAGIILGASDRVAPDVYARLPRSGTIVVVRVTETTESARFPIPYTQEILRDESMARGDTRLAHPGVAGEGERVYRIAHEDGVEVSRVLATERVLKEPVSETILVGTQGNLPAVPMSGTMAYVSGGNAWVMRTTSANKRPLTFSGDLDQRVFALSADGKQLAFTTRSAADKGLNSLWSLGTVVLGEAPQGLGVLDVLYAAWQDGGLLYSTGEATPGPPGWKANNDLWWAPVAGAPRRTLPAPAPLGLYSWWGREYALSPDGRTLAYAAADAVGLMNLATGERRVLAQFSVVHTYGDWVWTPGLAWSPDSRRLAAVLHGSPAGTESPEDSPVFDLWILPADGSVGERLAGNVGMWALPAWSPAGTSLAYGVAQEPARSQNSRYDVLVASLSTRQSKPLLGKSEWPGLLPQRVAWSPQGDQLALVYLGDLYLARLDGGSPRPITDDGRSSLPRWR